MPRPGQTPPIRAGAEAPHGTSAGLARLASSVPDQPPLGPPGSPENEGPAGGPVQELNDGYDEVIMSPTSRPDEPITAGAPFGPGPNFVRLPSEDDRTFMLRVADELSTSDAPSLGPYIAKIREGR